MANKESITASGFAVFVEKLLGRDILGQGLSDLNFTQKHEDRIAALEATAGRKAFVDLWRSADGDCDDAGEEFSLYGSEPFDYTEALAIFNCRYAALRSDGDGKTLYDASVVGVRKALFRVMSKYANGSTQFMYSGQKLIKAVHFPNGLSSTIASEMFSGCAALEEQTGILILAVGANASLMFKGCVSLREVHLCARNTQLYLADSPLLSSASVRRLAEYRDTNLGQVLTVTVHPDVFAKLTDETNAEWSAVLAKAAEKNITFATL